MARTFYNPYERDPTNVNVVTGGVIEDLNLDLSNIPANGEKRIFDIKSKGVVEFILEIKDNTTNYYYNFATKVFQAAKAKLEAVIANNIYQGSIVFPAVTGSDDKYDVFLYAKPGSSHSDYKEVRFPDGSLDINSSRGSNSLMMQKVIYQYSAITLTLQAYSPNSSVSGTFTSESFSIDRYKNKNKSPFSIKLTADPASSYQILKQPATQDLLSYLSLLPLKYLFLCLF